MGFESNSIGKQKAVSLHRAALRGLRDAGGDLSVPLRMWESYLARVANAGSRTQVHNITFRLEAMGLLVAHKKVGVELLPSDYSDLILSED